MRPRGVQRAIGLHRVTMLLVLVHASASDVRVKPFTTMAGLYHHGRMGSEVGEIEALVRELL
jgi:hypothetical protein